MGAWVGSLALVAPGALADVEQVSPGSLTTNFTEGLELFDAGFGFEGANYDNVIDTGFGLRIGERFAGQTVSDGTDATGFGVFDVIDGSPQNPLEIVAGAPTQNLVIGDTSSFGGPGHVIFGLSSVGWPDFDAFGEGAVALRFEHDQFEFGLTVFGESGRGDVRLDFYSRNGSHLGQISLIEVVDGPYAFRTTDGSASIAGIVITNNEDAGIGYDNFQYHLVPAPASSALLLGLALARRRR